MIRPFNNIVRICVRQGVKILSKITHICHSYPATIRAVLHVHPVVVIIPQRLNPKEGFMAGREGVPGQRFYKEVLWNFTLAG